MPLLLRRKGASHWNRLLPQVIPLHADPLNCSKRPFTFARASSWSKEMTRLEEIADEVGNEPDLRSFQVLLRPFRTRRLSNCSPELLIRTTM
ncbi:hypothetical protein BT93_B2212 [Corymbia citriodora subsp. variegata]|nr:hypothetical protein BT93_B2212 [Corymbia citriodora subsp. variegata]